MSLEDLSKRVDSLNNLVEYQQKRIARLEERSDETRDILTELQISIGNLSDYFTRQQRMESDIASLHLHLAKIPHLEDSIKRVEALLWGIAVALVPGILAILWELTKRFFGK